MYRLIWRPSNVASLTNESFSTPRRAKLNLNLIKNQLVLKDKRIKCLTECNRRLLKKVKTLKEMIVVLEKQNMLSEQASLILKVTKLYCIFNTTIYQLILICLN